MNWDSLALCWARSPDAASPDKPEKTKGLVVLAVPAVYVTLRKAGCRSALNWKKTGVLGSSLAGVRAGRRKRGHAGNMGHGFPIVKGCVNRDSCGLECGELDTGGLPGVG